MTVEGNASALVRLIAYEDLQCPDSAAYRHMLDQHLLSRYSQQVAFESREFPLPKHAWARTAAIASEYFYSISAQLAVAFRRSCYSQQPAISSVNVEDHIQQFAILHGLGEDWNTQEFAARVDREYNEGLAKGVRRTPTVFVGDAQLVETFTVDEISSLIERALEKASTSR